MSGYAAFLERKAQVGADSGFEATFLPDFLFGFQRDLVEWAVRKGRCAIFADCGLGKTPMQLVWAENVRRETGRPVLVLTPLAVAAQTTGEAEKFGIEAAVSRDGAVAAGITVTNYDRLHHFDPAAYGGVVCDESSAIKSFDGVRRQLVTDFMRKTPYRLLCTATAAPNDYIELGTSSEAIGELGHMDMLGRFFTNRDKNSNTKGRRYRWSQEGSFGNPEWRFKGHAEDAFWRWVASWARAMRRPSDLGYPNTGFDLPPLELRELVVDATHPRGQRASWDTTLGGAAGSRDDAGRAEVVPTPTPQATPSNANNPPPPSSQTIRPCIGCGYGPLWHSPGCPVINGRARERREWLVGVCRVARGGRIELVGWLFRADLPARGVRVPRRRELAQRVLRAAGRRRGSRLGAQRAGCVGRPHARSVLVTP